ncbi:MAG: HAMP domain-containing histidine kinase [Candidatus Eisenbacteria bacterium]|uniref:Signal transduction histidine-protein kinase/phosphatase MprB n=1 Tax=Eiseniibacteriota bacterium TaxID=2212470 RepID=A0A956RPD6_UNCEI|nr:HAMP domain-containing histidine kinase [Candidatus Eisenbacteria bacterium]
MRPHWVRRQLVTLLFLAVVLVLVSGFLELVSAVRLSTRQARVEASLVTGFVRGQLSVLAAAYSPDSLRAIGRDPRLESTLRDALVLAPSVARVGIADPEGITIAHTEPSRVGTIIQPYPDLPKAESFLEAVRLLVALGVKRQIVAYQIETRLEINRKLYAVIRVVLADTYIWQSVREAGRRGILTALIVVPIAALSGLALARMATGRLRTLEEGITALREGRFDEPLPDAGADEFSRLARELNLLGAEFQRRQKEWEEESSPPLAAVVAGQTRVLMRLAQMASGVAHELRNELQTIQSNLEVARLDPSRASEPLDLALQGVSNVGQSVRGFLKVARFRPLSTQHLQINDLLRHIREDLATNAALAGVELDLALTEDLPETVADPEVIRQAIDNLVRNALQALVETGGHVVLRSDGGDGTVSVIVEDDGPGMPDHVLAKAGTLYVTTRRDGSGVGLALVHQAMELHGGSVQIQSEKGQGTRITLVLPVVPA